MLENKQKESEALLNPLMEKPFSQACENNKQPILAVLKRIFANSKQVLEIGSGTGQHAVYFSSQLPHLIWQTSDLVENHAGINAWIDDSTAQNLRRPLVLNAEDESWPINNVEAVFSANTCHIMSWQYVINLFARLEKTLSQKAILAIYGPFNYGRKFTSESNARFDIWLKQQASYSGIRDFEKMDQLANNIGLTLSEDNAMPANNRLLVWEK